MTASPDHWWNGDPKSPCHCGYMPDDYMDSEAYDWHIRVLTPVASPDAEKAALVRDYSPRSGNADPDWPKPDRTQHFKWHTRAGVRFTTVSEGTMREHDKAIADAAVRAERDRWPTRSDFAEAHVNDHPHRVLDCHTCDLLAKYGVQQIKDTEAALANTAQAVQEHDRKVVEPWYEALKKARGGVLSGYAQEHLSKAGIFQDPPHDGKFADCQAPWCVRNQAELAALDNLLASLATTQPAEGEG